jgi:DNA-binding transcriptional LysR family regulator
MVEGEPDPELLAVVLAEDELILVASGDHALAALTSVSMDELAGHRYVRRGPAWSAELKVRELLGDAYDRADVLSLGHQEYVRAAVLAGLGFAALPRLAVESDLASGRLKALPTPSIFRSITAIRRRAQGGPVQEAFWTHLTGGEVPFSNTI